MIIKINTTKDVSPRQALAVSFIQLDEYDNLLKLELVNNVRHGTYFSRQNIHRYLNAIKCFGIAARPAHDDWD